MKKFTQPLKIIILAIILSLGVTYVFAWTPPTATPPGANTPAPINVSATSQYKDGALGIGGLIHGYVDAYFDGKVGIGTVTPTQKLDVNGTVKATGIEMPTGAGMGKVLTSDASGNASWETASAGGGLGMGQTWQSPERSTYVTYTNTTGRPIAISVSTISNAPGSRLYIDGSLYAETWENTGGVGSYNQLFAIIPAGSTYYLDSAVFNQWRELR